MGKIRKPELYGPKGGIPQGPFIIYSLHYRVFLAQWQVGTRPARLALCQETLAELRLLFIIFIINNYHLFLYYGKPPFICLLCGFRY